MRRLLLIAFFASLAMAQPQGIAGKRHARLVVRNAMVVDGSGTPMSGPLDILIESDTITAIGNVPARTAGFIYSLYGFGLIREMELQQETGFPALKVIQHATANNAKILGQEARLGRLRVGYAADLIIVDGNPVENLKVLYPIGVDELRDGKVVHTNGIEWTIKDGIPYYGPALRAEVKEIVNKARALRTKPQSGTP